MVEIATIAGLPEEKTARAAPRLASAIHTQSDSTKDEPLALIRTGTALQVIASLFWIPQAGLIAMSVGNIAAGNADHIFWRTGGVLAIGVLRSVLDALRGRIAFRRARAMLSRHRRDAVAKLAAGSPIDATRPASGFAASGLAEQSEAIVPYLARYQPARLRAAVGPLAILLCVLVWLSG